MAVYVDDMRARYRRMVMYHMLADSDDELHAMADKIGVRRKWHQKPGTATSHYDVCQTKRQLAVQFGAIEITSRQAAAMVARRRATGSIGTPCDAERWHSQYLEERRARENKSTELDHEREQPYRVDRPYPQ